MAHRPVLKEVGTRMH